MSDCSFIYVRDEAPQVELPDGTLQKSRGFPVGCVAFRVEEQAHNLTLKWGYSVFNPHDKFSKAEARRVAQERLDTAPRATYGTVAQGAGPLLVEALRQMGDCNVHQWASSNQTNLADNATVTIMHALPMRFREACHRTAKQLRQTAQRKVA